MDMSVQASRTAVAAVWLSGLCFAQQEPVTPSFHAQSNLVTVPFQVRRGSRSVSDLKSSDVVLLEDGVPRNFTIFEAPAVHLTLDLMVMFDVTNPAANQKTGSVGFWDTKGLQELAHYWNEAIARRLTEGHGATIRFSIYRFDQSKLQRLCQTAGDPKVLLDALHRLVPAGRATGQNVDIPLPAGLMVRDLERKALANGAPPEPWSLTGALSVLRDSAVAPQFDEEKTEGDKATTARALVIFSTGAEGTALTPQDLAGQAVTAGVPIYPVALRRFPYALPYDGYGSDGLMFWDLQFEGPRGSMFGPGGLQLFCRDGTQNPGCYGVKRALYINYPFELLGELTGGVRFEAVYHPPTVTPGEDGPGFVLSAAPTTFSMTGAETADILERIKQYALARFSSTYTVGFVPSPSGAPRQHDLEVRLPAKSNGKVTEGKRSAVY